MTDIAAIESRLRAALDRIAAGAEKLPAAGAVKAAEAAARAAAESTGAGASSAAEAELAKVRAALESETAAHGQLADRVKAIRDKQDQTVGQLEKRVMALEELVVAKDGEIQRIRRVNNALRHNAKALRRAVAEGLSDAALVNASMEVELAATQAAQATDRAELDSILSELAPLIEEKADV